MQRHLNHYWREWVIGIGCLLMLLLFWGTAVSTSWARIDALQTIEPYGSAVHEQLLFNFAQHSDFFQTVHLGYDDTWTWSDTAPSPPAAQWADLRVEPDTARVLKDPDHLGDLWDGASGLARDDTRPTGLGASARCFSTS